MLRRKKNVVNRGCLFLAHGTTVNIFSWLSRINVDSSREGISFGFLSVYMPLDWITSTFWWGGFELAEGFALRVGNN